jgi:hypothetical protein
MFDDENIVEFDDLAEEAVGLTEEDNPFDKAILDDLEMEWTDEGETIIRPSDPNAEVVYVEEGEEEAAETSTEPQPTQAPSDVKATDWEDRYKNLQSWSDRVQTENQALKETVARLEGRVDEISTQQQGTPEEADTLDEVDLSDPAAVKEWMRAEVRRGVEEILPNAQQMTIDHEVGRELQSAIVEIPDFMQYMPMIQRFYQQFPNTEATYQQAYKIVKTFVPDKPTAAQPASETAQPQGETPQAPSQQPTPSAESREALEAKARRLRTEEGVHSSETTLGGGEVKDIQDAMQMAADELYE